MGPLLLASVPLVYSIRIDQAVSKVPPLFQWPPRAFMMTNDRLSLKRIGEEIERIIQAFLFFFLFSILMFQLGTLPLGYTKCIYYNCHCSMIHYALLPSNICSQAETTTYSSRTRFNHIW